MCRMSVQQSNLPCDLRAVIALPVASYLTLSRILF